MGMNENERDDSHFEESMFEVLKGLEGMPVKGKDGKIYSIEEINTQIALPSAYKKFLPF